MFGTISHRWKVSYDNFVRRRMQRWLVKRGYAIQRAGGGYIDARETVRAARDARLSLCEYLESQEEDTRKRGRRDRIIEQMRSLGCFNDVSRVIEIGAGTGMYLDRTIEHAKPECYEIYETAPDWREFLCEHTSTRSLDVRIHNADGHSLRYSEDASSELVHAHGVLVYLTTVQAAGYLKEMARVCRPGGCLVFDCYLDCSFDRAAVDAWIASRWSFPVVLPKRLLEEMYRDWGLTVESRFQEIHGASVVDYEVLRKL